MPIWVHIINISLVNTNYQLGNFLCNNYKQALDIIADGERILPGLMQDLNITDGTTFKVWLREEKYYLEGLQREPEEETHMMEYWQRLVKLNESMWVQQWLSYVYTTNSVTSRKSLNTAMANWSQAMPQD